MEKQEVRTPADEAERRVVAAHQGDLTGLCPERGEFEIAVEVGKQSGRTRHPPVHRNHQPVFALIRFRKINLDRLPKAFHARERAQTERELFAVAVGGSRARRDQATRIGAHSRPDLVEVAIDLDEVLNQHVATQDPAIHLRRTEPQGFDPCDQ